MLVLFRNRIRDNAHLLSGGLKARTQSKERHTVLHEEYLLNRLLQYHSDQGTKHFIMSVTELGPKPVRVVKKAIDPARHSQHFYERSYCMMYELVTVFRLFCILRTSQNDGDIDMSF